MSGLAFFRAGLRRQFYLGAVSTSSRTTPAVLPAPASVTPSTYPATEFCVLTKAISAPHCRMLSTMGSSTAPKINTSDVVVSETKAATGSNQDNNDSDEKVLVESCGDVDDSDDDMEQEEMFVEPHQSFEYGGKEWGGPRRGGRLPEPTRFGDWERKGRCSDF